MDALLAFPGTYHEWFGFFLDAIVTGSILLAITALLTLGLRGTSAAQRHLMWTLALCSTLCIPILSLAVRGCQMSPIIWQNPLAETVGISPTADQGSVSSPGNTGSQSVLLPSNASHHPLSTSTPPQQTRIPFKPQHTLSPALIPIIWGIGLIALLIPLLLGLLGLRRVTRTAQPMDDLLIATMVADICSQLRLHRPVPVLITAWTTTPFTWGWLRPVLLLPMEAISWSDARLRLVLLHELAHIQRGDWLTQLVTQLICAIYWFNPLVWFADHQLRRERELACDDVVLTAGLHASVYASHLLDIAQRIPRRSLLCAAAITMARRTGLERRIRAILVETLNRRALPRWVVLGAVVLVALCLLPIALLQCQIAVPQTSTTTLLVEWRGVVDQRLVARLLQQSTTQRISSNNYQAFRISNAQLLGAVSNANSSQRFGFEPMIDWKEPCATPTNWAGGGGSSITIGREGEMLESNFKGTYVFAPTHRLLKLSIDYEVLSCTIRHDNQPTSASVNGSLRYNGLLRPNESLVFVGAMGEYHGTHPQYLIVWQAVEVPNQLTTAVKQIREANIWVRPNIIHLVKRAEAWRQQSVGMRSTKWKRTFSDGTTVHISSIIRNAEYPLIQWDGDGNPVNPDTSLFTSGQQDYPEAYFQLTRPSSARKHFDTDPSSPSQFGYGLGLAGDVENQVGVGVGVGDTWITRGVFKHKGDTVNDGNYRIRITAMDSMPASATSPSRTHIQVEFCSHLPNQEARLVALDNNRHEYLINDGNNIEVGAEKYASSMTTFDRTIDVATSHITRIELRTRPREWVTFSHVATKPSPVALQQAERTASQW